MASLVTMLHLDESRSPDSRVVKFSPTYKLIFSLLNQESSHPSDPVMQWDIESLLARKLFFNIVTLEIDLCLNRRTYHAAPELSINIA